MSDESVFLSEKKRIIFGTTVGMSAEALLKGQLAWFREKGWDVTLVTSPDNGAKRAVERERVSLFGIPMKRDISLASDLKSALNWLRLIKDLRPEVVNLGTPKASLLGSFAAWVWRVPRRIYTVRGLRLEGTLGFMTRLLWLMERATILMSTDVIAVSPSLGQELVKRSLISPEKVWIIGSGSSNGVDTSAVQKRIIKVDKDGLKNELGIDPSKFVLGYIGRVSRAKGVDTLLSALQDEKLVAEVELLIVGTIEDAELGAVIREMGDRVHIVPWTNDVWRYLPAMDLLCLPTQREGFPNTVLEAAAAGIPTITTRATGAIDSVVDSETGFLIDIGDVESTVERIRLLMDDQALLSYLGSNAKKRVENHFKPGNVWLGIEAIAEGRTEPAQLKRLDEYLESSNTK